MMIIIIVFNINNKNQKKMSTSFLLPNSSRHMNRNEAEMIIRFNLSEHCYFDRPQDWDKSVFDTLDMMNQKVGHDIRFMMSNDQFFPKFMQLFGAMYWDREFNRCCKSQELNGTDSVPFTDCILPVSLILKPSNTYGEYGIITDPYFLNNPADVKTKFENIRIMDELDKSHNLVGLLVEGYMWARGCERQVEKRYSKDPDKAYQYLLNKALAQFGLTMNDIHVYH